MDAFTKWLADNAHFGPRKIAEAVGVTPGRAMALLSNARISVMSARRRLKLPPKSDPPGAPPAPPPRPHSESPAPPVHERPAEGINIHKRADKLSADVVIQTPRGRDLSLAEALENPRFRKALQSSEIVLDDFEIIRFKVNSWDVTLNLRGKIEQRTNHQFWIEWKRIAPAPIAMALRRLVERIKPAPAHKAAPRDGKRMVEVALYDLHFGMLAWKAEVGEDYDTKIAAAVLADATAQIIARTRALKPEYYLVPIGNDAFHVNDGTNLTPQNKNRLDVDTRLAQVIEIAERSLEAMVEALARVAPVRLLWVPGNHDPQTSYWLLRVLAARYRDDARVDVDTSPKPRKVHLYGKNLIGFMHGCDLAQSKEKALAGILADESADVWAPGQYREIHRGHTHKKNELYFIGAETYGSVVVRTIPSLVGTDEWHFRKGFVETSKTAQFFVWHKTYGLESVSDIHVSPAIYHKE